MLKSTSEEKTEIKKEVASILKDLGFSSYASQAFVAVCESSPVSASSICERTGIPDSKIYYALKELEDSGLVTRIGGTPQLYSAQDPKGVAEVARKIIKTQFEKKEAQISRLEKIVKPISKSSDGSDTLEIAYITRGFDNVIRRLRKLLTSANKEVIGYVWDEEIYSTIGADIEGLNQKDIRMKLALNPGFKNGSVLPMVSNKRILTCECNLFVVDKTKMITITKTRADSYYAIITEDPGMISLGISYYDNPTCCVK